MIFASVPVVKVRDRWFDLTTVHMRRPFVASDRSRFRMFFETFEQVSVAVVAPDGHAEQILYRDGGQFDGSVDTWVRRWQVRKYERAGWRRA